MKGLCLKFKDIDLDYGGWGSGLYVHEGGNASGVRLGKYDRDAFMSLNGGVATDTTIERGALRVSSGGIAQNTVMSGYQEWDGRWYLGGAMTVSEGGLGVDTKIIRSIQTVSRGGIASRTTITSMGSQVVSNGGMASETTLTDGGRLIVSRGGVAKKLFNLYVKEEKQSFADEKAAFEKISKTDPNAKAPTDIMAEKKLER